MRFCLDAGLRLEASYRVEYMHSVFGLYFVNAKEESGFIIYESFPKNILDICFIVGHNHAVSTFLNRQMIEEKTVVIVSCDGGYKNSFCIKNKKVFLSYRNDEGLTLMRKGENYMLEFDPTDSELYLYNSNEENINERIKRSFDRIDI